MRLTTPSILKYLFPGLIWRIRTNEKCIYLTFDDGPHPDITKEVLRILDEKQVKATFFCVGENVSQYQDTYQQILAGGHATGNHCYNHLNGWKTPDKDYFDNINQCSEWVQSDLFRPPYGRIKPSQIKVLKKQFRIIMCSVISYDFDQSMAPEACLKNSIKNTKPGTIIVFHDSAKASGNMLYALPRHIDHFASEGYRFDVL